VKNLGRFREFVARFSELVDRHGADEVRVLEHGSTLLAELVRHDDWLPDEFAAHSAESYRQLPPLLRPTGAILGGQLRLGPGAEDARSRPHGVGHGRDDARAPRPAASNAVADAGSTDGRDRRRTS